MKTTIFIACAGLFTTVAAFQLHPLRTSISFRFQRDRPVIHHHQLHLSKTNNNNGAQDDGLEQLKKTLTFSQFDINSDGKVSLSELKVCGLGFLDMS